VSTTGEIRDASLRLNRRKLEVDVEDPAPGATSPTHRGTPMRGELDIFKRSAGARSLRRVKSDLLPAHFDLGKITSDLLAIHSDLEIAISAQRLLVRQSP